MKALILAAGRGERLGSAQPKCLEVVGGQSVLARMLGALAGVVDEAWIVVGFEAEALREEAEASAPRPPLRFVENERYGRGSVLSLSSGLEALERAGVDAELLVMDADVLFPQELLDRLVEGPGDSFLLDPRSEASGEEMMLVARGGRVLRIARAVEASPGDLVGEGVGFLKLTGPGQSVLREEVRALVERGELDCDYEDAVDAALARHAVSYVEVGGLPWTEIDFPEDLARAREEILPAIPD